MATDDDIADEWTHDEALTVTPCRPAAVVHPGSTDEVAAVVRVAAELGVPVTARGSGTGLSGACVPRSDGLVVAFDRMAQILEIDPANDVAVVQPGVTLDQLDQATGAAGLVYPVFPGESSASLGGNVATNAGGMRAVKYGVTRHQVLGLEAVTGTGEVIRTGGRLVKTSAGYDLTQLIVGSEGTLALVTEATLRLHPRPGHAGHPAGPVPHPGGGHRGRCRPSWPRGVGPMLVEYIDALAMGGIVGLVGLDLGVDAAVRDQTEAWLVVVVEQRRADRLAEDAEELAVLLAEQGALDVFVLPARGRHPAHRGPREGLLGGQGGRGRRHRRRGRAPIRDGRLHPPGATSWPRRRPRWSPAAVTWATATCTSRSSSPTPRCADSWSTT